MSEPFIPAPIINPVAHSILSNHNSAINTSVCDWSSFIDTPMKDDTANHHNTVSHYAKENNATAHHALVTSDHEKI